MCPLFELDDELVYFHEEGQWALAILRKLRRQDYFKLKISKNKNLSKLSEMLDYFWGKKKKTSH